jgi:hypothetical protein
MLPLTRDLPKPMLPIWGVPAIERTLRLLRGWGVRDVLINLHHLPDAIRGHVESRKDDGLNIRFSPEPEILGTGGALKRAEGFVGSGLCWVINADVVCDLDPERLLRAFRPGKTISSVWLHPSRGPRTVETRRGYVTNWRGRNGATFCGLQLLAPEILNYLPPAGEASVVVAHEKAMADGWKVAGVEVPGAFWADIGTPKQYLAAHRDLRGRKAFVFVDRSARVAKDATIGNSVVLAGARILAGARVEHAVIGRDAVVRGAVGYLAMPAERALEKAERAAVEELGWDVRLVTALPLGPRGSARTFTRLQRGRRSAMLVRYDPTRIENTLYAGHARFLRGLGVRVPLIAADRPRDCLTIFEDLGDRSIQTEIRHLSEDQVRRCYRRVLDQMLTFHERGARAARARGLTLVPSFRWKLYRWEHEYFIEHFLKGRLGLPDAALPAIRADLESVAAQLSRAPRVLVHRDLQSSNILLHRGRPAFIDFQGMRYGPAAYDLASLLCDPYVMLSEATQLSLLEYYAARSAHPDVARRTFWPAALQRLGQALGAYAKLGSQPDTASFAEYIPPALKMLRRALAHTPTIEALKHLIEKQ